MFSGEDDPVVADSQSPVGTAGQSCHLPGERCGVLGKLLNLGDDPLPVPCGETAHVPDRPRPPFDLHSLIHTLYFRQQRAVSQEANADFRGDADEDTPTVPLQGARD